MTTMVFGDADPEDGWSAGDPPGEKVGILVRMVLSIALEQDRVRALVRLGFATSAVEALRLEISGPDLEPTLDALDLAFYYLTVSASA